VAAAFRLPPAERAGLELASLPASCFRDRFLTDSDPLRATVSPYRQSR
jgi:hypothetical protein